MQATCDVVPAGQPAWNAYVPLAAQPMYYPIIRCFEPCIIYTYSYAHNTAMEIGISRQELGDAFYMTGLQVEDRTGWMRACSYKDMRSHHQHTSLSPSHLHCDAGVRPSLPLHLGNQMLRGRVFCRGRLYSAGVRILLARSSAFVHLNFCSLVFTSADARTMQMLQVAQNAGIRFICNVLYRGHLTEHRRRMGFLRPATRTRLQYLILLHIDVYRGWSPALLDTLHLVSRDEF